MRVDILSRWSWQDLLIVWIQHVTERRVAGLEYEQLGKSWCYLLR